MLVHDIRRYGFRVAWFNLKFRYFKKWLGVKRMTVVLWSDKDA